jgi:hypothetical protein
MTRIPAIRLSALLGALVIGFLPFHSSSSSASPVLIDENSHMMDTTSRLHRIDLTIAFDDQGDDASAKGRFNHMGDAWHDATLSSTKTFLLDADHLGISPTVGDASIINASILPEGGHDVMNGEPGDLPGNDTGASPKGLFSRVVSAMTSAAASIPLSLPLFGLALICLSVIARRGKKQADLT